MAPSSSIVAMTLTLIFQVAHRPSIGKFDRAIGLQEPKARESLLTPSMRARTTSSGSVQTLSPSIEEDEKSQLRKSSSPPPSISSLSIAESSTSEADTYTPLVQQLSTMERTPFAIDEAKDDGEGLDDDDDDLDGDGLVGGVKGGDDTFMMDEVSSSTSLCFISPVQC